MPVLHFWVARLPRPRIGVEYRSSVGEVFPLLQLSLDPILGFKVSVGDGLKGGHCLVGWQKVYIPLELGGLGIHNLEVLGWSLNMRWLWLRKTQPGRPWAGLDIHVHPNAAALFAISVQTVIGDRAATLFWTDRWLEGKSLADLAPNLVTAVPKCVANSRTVRQALLQAVWVQDIRENLTPQAFGEFFLLWDLLQEVQLVPGTPDQHHWSPSSSGLYSSKSAYDRFFIEAGGFEPTGRI
jgi:hypothetical protein